MSVCLCVCVSVCVSVCLAAMRFRIFAPAATKLHTRTKDFPGKVLKQCRSDRLIERAGVRSCHGFFHDCSNMTVWPRTNLLHHCEREHKITAA